MLPHSRKMFREGWVVINSVPTHVLTWGGWIEDKIEADSIFLFVPGNPGRIGFYPTFLGALHAKIKMPVWAFNLTGAEMPYNPALKCPSIKRHKEFYTLSGQIKHKYEFIKTYIPPDKKLYIGGHSVGARIVTDLMKHKDIECQTKKLFLLFPTLEQIAETPNGKRLAMILRFLLPVVLFLSWIFSMFPMSLKKFLVSTYSRLMDGLHWEEEILEESCKLVHPKPLRGVFTLAKDELISIKELDEELLQSLVPKLACYYSAEDGWAPLEHYNRLRSILPGVQAELVNKKIKHAFVIGSSLEVAEILAKGIGQE